MKGFWRIAAGTAVVVVVAAVVLIGGRTGRETVAPSQPVVLPSAPIGVASGAVAPASSPDAFSAYKRFAAEPITRITPGYSSPPLRELPSVVGPVAPRPEFVEPPSEAPPAAEPKAGFTDPVVQKTAGPKVMPASTSFAGLSNQDNATLLGTSARPPDSEGDVGPGHYVEWINLVMRIYDKFTFAPVTAAQAGNVIFSSLPGTSLCNTQNNGDPLVVYDQLANRWVLSQFAFNGVNMAGAPQPPYEQCVAVSKTSDPTGAYCLYDFNVSNTSFNDYGKIGVWPDGYYFSFGMFAGGAAYAGPGAMVVERPQMIQSACPAAKSAFYDPNNLAALANVREGLPSDVDGPNPPPASRPNFFLFPNATNNGLQLWKFSVVDWSPVVPVTTFLKNATDITVPPYDPSIACSPTSRHCVPQAGTPNKLDLVGNRLMYRLAYRNWGATPPAGIPANTESLVTNETVDANDPNANHVAVRWYEIRDPNGSPTAFQAATYAPDADHRWMASAAQDHGGNLAIGYTASGSIFPTPRYAGRLLGDTVSTLGQGEATMFTPPGPAPVATGTAGDQRWGDYSHLGTDPIDDCTFWYISEYMSDVPLSIDGAGVLRNWQTRIGHFRFPPANCMPPTAVAVKSFQARWQGRQIAVTWRTATEAQIVGFNVFRSVGARAFHKVNRTLIAASRAGTTRGAHYTLTDRAVARGKAYTYRLQVVDRSGKRDWYGVGSAAAG